MTPQPAPSSHQHDQHQQHELHQHHQQHELPRRLPDDDHSAAHLTESEPRPTPRHHDPEEINYSVTDAPSQLIVPAVGEPPRASATLGCTWSPFRSVPPFAADGRTILAAGGAPC